jgi:hypothetical protein
MIFARFLQGTCYFVSTRLAGEPRRSNRHGGGGMITCRHVRYDPLALPTKEATRTITGGPHQQINTCEQTLRHLVQPEYAPVVVMAGCLHGRLHDRPHLWEWFQLMPVCL